jgi:hypothetical protein
MNKIIVLFWALLNLSSAVTLAQSGSLTIGLEGGPNRSTLWGNEHIQQYKKSRALENVTNYSSGVSVEYSFTDLLSLRSGIAFERKGLSYKVYHLDQWGNQSEEIPGRKNFDYIILPLMARVTIGNKPIFFVNAGPYLGFLLRQTDLLESSSLQHGSSTDYTETYKRLDMGISAGIGAGLPITERAMLTMEVRHNLGLYNISDVPVYNGGTVKTKSTNLLIGIAYKLKG